MMIILSENLDSECFLIDIVIKVVLCVFLILLFGKGSKKTGNDRFVSFSFPVLFLSECFGELPYLGKRWFFIVKDIIYSIEYRHLDIVFFIYFFNTFSAVIAFCHHFHFDLCCFYRIPFAYHRAECVISAESGISRYKQVSEINRFTDVSVYRIHGIDKTI